MNGMTTNDIAVLMYAHGAAGASRRAEGMEQKCKAAMRFVLRDNWLGVPDEVLLTSAVGGVLLDVQPDSKAADELALAMLALKRFDTFLAAARAGLSPDPTPLRETSPLPLLGWWLAVKDEVTAETA